MGDLLSSEKLAQSRITGCFSVDDFQLMSPDSDALDQLQVLDSLEICTQCHLDGDIEYEFPCLNFVETIDGLWEKSDDKTETVSYGGFRFQTPPGISNQLVHLFPRLQVHLRRYILNDNHENNELYQWYHGSKFCSGEMECMMSMEEKDQVIELKARGPVELKTTLFYFLDDMCNMLEQIFNDICPGLQLDKYLMSVTHLQEHTKELMVYDINRVMLMQISGKTTLKLDEERNEEWLDLACFGSREVQATMTLGIDLHISHLTIHARRKLSMLLDSPDPMGRDWCLLAVALGLADKLPLLDVQNRDDESKTDKTLEEWSKDSNATIGELLNKVKELCRQDALDVVLASGPLFRVFPSEEQSQEEGTCIPSHTSTNTNLSNLSR